MPAGAAVCTDAPLLLVIAADATGDACAACLRRFAASPHAATPCGGCGRVAFCSPECVAAAGTAPSWHTPAVCACLAALDVSGLDADAASSARLAATLTALAGDAAAAAALAPLQTMTAPPTAASPTLVAQLAPRVAAAAAAASLPPPPDAALAQWLAIEAANAFAVVDAATPGDPGSRRVRGCGLYPGAALFNHDCLPSVARTDAFDSAELNAHARTALSFTTLHALPAGEEATLSYVPLGWPRGDRGPRFAEDYGFCCGCARCAFEADGDPLPPHAQPAADPSYIAVYLAKYECAECGGTLVPTGPADDADVVCNVCGRTRTHAEFLAALEGEDDGSEWSE